MAEMGRKAARPPLGRQMVLADVPEAAAFFKRIEFGKPSAPRNDEWQHAVGSVDESSIY